MASKLYLAEAEKELGLDISETAITEMKDRVRITDKEFEHAAVEEQKRRHDVCQQFSVLSSVNLLDLNGYFPLQATRKS